MSKENFTPDEQRLIESLRQIPKPILSAEKLVRIREQITQEATLLAASPKTIPLKLIYILVFIALVLSLLILALWFFNVQSPSESPATATSSEELATAEPSPELSPEATEIPMETLMILEGPVAAIQENLLYVYDFELLLEANHPILSLIDIGQLVHVEGHPNSDKSVTVVSITIMADGEISASLDGPVEAINGNMVVVNGISVQFEPDDPILPTLVVGDFLSVQGNFVSNGTIIVLLVVNVVVVDISVDVDYCWYHEGMGMGHWHCDGMGMGGMGMGMGN